MEQIGQVFLASARKRLAYYKQLGDASLACLSTAQLLYTPHQSCNSIAQIVQHLSGNMLSRWTDVLTTDGEKDWRKRDEEFEVILTTKEQVLAAWEKGWACFLSALDQFTEADLLITIFIRTEPLTLLDAISRQLAHYPYHIGQMIHIGKTLLQDDWTSLSIPKNQSEAYHSAMRQSK